MSKIVKKMPLIDEILAAIKSGQLSQPFTTEQLKEWINANKIVKDNGEAYAKASINAILSNSDISNSSTTNRNKKLLCSRFRDDGKKEYYFRD